MKLTGKYRERFVEEATTCRTIGYYLYLFMTACLWILNDFQREIPVTISNVLKLQATLAILLAVVHGIILWEEYRKQLQSQRQEMRMKRTRSKPLMLGLVILTLVLPAYAADLPAKTTTATIPVATSMAPLTGDFVAKIFRAENVHKFIQNNLTNAIPLWFTFGDVKIGFGVDQLKITNPASTITVALDGQNRICWNQLKEYVRCDSANALLKGITEKDLVDAVNAILADQSTADSK